MIKSKQTIQELLADMKTMPAREKLELLEDLEKLEKRKKLQDARDDFLKFCHAVYPGFKEGPHHRHLKPKLQKICHEENGRMTISMPPRMGKALEVNTEIPTPDRGFVRIADLRVGDAVFAGDGSVTIVTGVSPVWKSRPVYRVHTNDGFSVVADAAHEWAVVKDRKRPKQTVVDTAYVHYKTQGTREARALRIPLQGPAQYPEAALPIHPYVLGVWLGDGRTDGPALCTADDFIFDKVNAIEGPEFTEYAKRGKTRHWRPGRTRAGGLNERLKSLGLINNKSIPATYLHAAYSQRLDLLHGLMDTDGTVGKNGCASFYSTNERLARQVQELVQSLGVKASLCSGPAMLNGVQHGTCWKVHFFFENAASLPRKVERCRNATRTTQRYIRAEPAGIADTVCIEVAHHSHLFLCTRGYIPTHNSELTSYLFVAWYMGHHPDHHIMMVTHTATLSASFGRKVRNLIDSPAYQEIFPGTKVSKDKSAADDWTTTVGGKYLAVGVGASIAGHGAHLCLDPNAEVLTSNGVRLLQSIVVGDTLITAQGRFEVTKKMLTTHTEGVSINEALLASGTHPFYTQRGWVPAGQLRPGDRIETRTVWMALWDKAKHTLRKILRLKRGSA